MISHRLGMACLADRIVVLLANLPDGDEAVHAAKRIITVLDVPFVLEGRTIAT